MTNAGNGDAVSFNTTGAVSTTLGTAVAGYANNGSINQVAIVRYLSDGTLDTSFNTTGYLLTNSGGTDSFLEAIAYANGKIYGAGYVTTSGQTNFAVIRLNSDGALDTTFHTDGMAMQSIISGSDSASSLVIQTDGKIVAGG